MSDIQKSPSRAVSSSDQCIIVCRECSAGNVLYEELIHYTSHLDMYITCGECQEYIMLDANCSDNKEGEESSAMDGCESPGNEAEILKGKRRKCQFRILKSSDAIPEESKVKPREEEMQFEVSDANIDFDSTSHCGNTESWPHDQPMEAFPDLTLLDENLKRFLDMIREHPCFYCGCSERSLLVPVTGDRFLTHCLSCQGVFGVDDSMNYYDYQKFVDDCRVAACTTCGNDDPNRFIFVEVKGHDDQSTLTIRCMECQPAQPEELKIYCSCQNTDATKFKIVSNVDSSTVESVCEICGKTQSVDIGNVTVLDCQCSEANAQYEFDEYGYIVLVKCQSCGASMSTNNNTAASKLPNDGSSRGRTKVKSLDMIRRGDHIAWHQCLGYWHHAIVVEVQYDMMKVIHYNGPAAHKGQIVEDWITVDPKKEQLYRIDYDAKFQNPPETVIKRARTRLGEHSYNLLTNNCEHFARWCATGNHCSLQVQGFYKTVAERFAWSAQGRFAQYLVKLGFTIAKPSRGTAMRSANMLDKVWSYFAPSGSKVASSQLNSVPAVVPVSARPVAAGLSIAYEVISATRDIHNAYQQRKEGAINREEFLRVTIKRTCEGVGALAGTAITLTIPIANNVVGLTLGTVIGKGIGGLVGRNVARVVR